ncbi:MAG TPA: hypothetical protein VHO66_02470 [Ruminiclostridium sp.]|nr:hypothetical protein [Ruminiclostridium sp.]
MSDAKRKNLLYLKKIAENKTGYGICQIENLEISPRSKVMSDERAIRGKQILREKIYGR